MNKSGEDTVVITDDHSPAHSSSAFFAELNQWYFYSIHFFLFFLIHFWTDVSLLDHLSSRWDNYLYGVIQHILLIGIYHSGNDSINVPISLFSCSVQFVNYSFCKKTFFWVFFFLAISSGERIKSIPRWLLRSFAYQADLLVSGFCAIVMPPAFSYPTQCFCTIPVIPGIRLQR